MTQNEEHPLAKRFQRTFEAGKLAGAIETYEALLTEFRKQPPRSFVKLTTLIGTFATALLILKEEKARRQLQLDQERVEVEEKGEEEPSVP